MNPWDVARHRTYERTQRSHRADELAAAEAIFAPPPRRSYLHFPITRRMAKLILNAAYGRMMIEQQGRVIVVIDSAAQLARLSPWQPSQRTIPIDSVAGSPTGPHAYNIAPLDEPS